VLAIPSGDFGNCPHDNGGVKKFVMANNIHYLLAGKAAVKEGVLSPVYSWLTTAAQNGFNASPVKEDYYKYLISKEGKLVGLFSKAEDILGKHLKMAIEQ
jgi:glutathione peroxidase-family protein